MSWNKTAIIVLYLYPPLGLQGLFWGEFELYHFFVHKHDPNPSTPVDKGS